MGFAASLATLSAVVVNSSKTLYNFRHKLQNTRDDVKRLLNQFEIFEGLLEEIQRIAQQLGSPGIPRGLQNLWEGSSAQMQEDMERFEDVVTRFDRLLQAPSISSKKLRLRMRHIFDEDTVAAFQRQISAHTETLTLIQALLQE